MKALLHGNFDCEVNEKKNTSTAVFFLTIFNTNDIQKQYGTGTLFLIDFTIEAQKCFIYLSLS